jgi:hypothetical protein
MRTYALVPLLLLVAPGLHAQALDLAAEGVLQPVAYDYEWIVRSIDARFRAEGIARDTLHLELKVDQDGAVESCTVRGERDERVRSAACDAVADLRCTPARRGGGPVASMIVIDVMPPRDR